ncbi:MAG TPA: APC family permease [Chloroflexota bacterium]|nr:APC family permease [Chloroflexota bacterium]
MDNRNLADNNQEPRLTPQLGVGQTMAVALGAMLGAGVYVSMGQAAGTTGGSLLVAVVLGAVVATINGLSSAELGAYDPRAGGAYQFARNLVTPAVGFVAGWLFLFAALTAGGTYALTFGAYLEALLPGVPLRAVGVALVAVAVISNMLGVRISGRVSVALVVINVAILLAFVGLALPAFTPHNLRPFVLGGARGFLQASALLFFAYTGYARPVTVAEEVRDPAWTLPRAVPTAVGIVMLLYFGVAFAALGVLGPERLGEEAAPLRAAMVAAGSPAGATLLAVGALLASFAVLLTEIWGLSRLAFAMGRNGDLPACFGRLSGPGLIPRNAVLAAGSVLVLLAAFADLRPLLEASSLALLVYYWVMNLSALRLPPERRLYPLVVPVAGIVANPVVGLSLPLQTLVVVGAMAVTGLAYFALLQRLRK